MSTKEPDGEYRTSSHSVCVNNDASGDGRIPVQELDRISDEIRAVSNRNDTGHDRWRGGTIEVGESSFEKCL